VRKEVALREAEKKIEEKNPLASHFLLSQLRFSLKPLLLEGLVNDAEPPPPGRAPGRGRRGSSFLFLLGSRSNGRSSGSYGSGSGGLL